MKKAETGGTFMEKRPLVICTDPGIDDFIALRVDFLANEFVNFAVGIVLFDKFFDAVV